MSKAYQTGDDVEWDWGNGTAQGKIRDVHTTDVSKTIKGTDVSRNADEECPAYTIEQEDGDIVLKSHTEVRKAS